MVEFFFEKKIIHPCIGAQYYRRFLAKYAKFRQQIWADRQGINPRDKNQKQANFCSQVVSQLRTPYSIKALCTLCPLEFEYASQHIVTIFASEVIKDM